MPTFTTYDQVGRAESVSDILSDISPFDTPFFSMIKSEKVAARNFEWLEDTLEAAGVNAAVEGADATSATLTSVTNRTNTTQILTKSFTISATSDVVKTYGRAKETALQLSKALKTIKKDLEYAMVGVDQAAVSGNSSTARQMGSVSTQITSTINAGTAALTEAMILTAGQSAYEAGSDPSVLMIKPADSLVVAGFAASAGRVRELYKDKSITNAIDVYVGPFGSYKTVINRHSLADSAWLIDPSMFRSVTLRPFTRTLLSKTGDSDKHFVVGEMSVKHTNFGDSVRIYGLT
jgi:hypothetical protein